jgi:hypothetical protein
LRRWSSGPSRPIRSYVSGEDMWRHRREASNSAASVSFAAT